MSIPRFSAFLAVLIIPAALFAQMPSVNPRIESATAAPADETRGDETRADETRSAPRLEHFDPDLVDKTLDPCNDFYKYSCSKWLAANPIPPDQVYWGTGSGLQLWNENLLRDTLEAAAKASNRSPVQQKIGDYWAACMDEEGIEAAGLKPLQPELDRIAALKSKKEITAEIVHLHHLYTGAWQPADKRLLPPESLRVFQRNWPYHGPMPWK